MPIETFKSPFPCWLVRLRPHLAAAETNELYQFFRERRERLRREAGRSRHSSYAELLTLSVLSNCLLLITVQPFLWGRSAPQSPLPWWLALPLAAVAFAGVVAGAKGIARPRRQDYRSLRKVIRPDEVVVIPEELRVTTLGGRDLAEAVWLEHEEDFWNSLKVGAAGLVGAALVLVWWGATSSPVLALMFVPVFAGWLIVTTRAAGALLLPFRNGEFASYESPRGRLEKVLQAPLSPIIPMFLPLPGAILCCCPAGMLIQDDVSPIISAMLMWLVALSLFQFVVTEQKRPTVEDEWLRRCECIDAVYAEYLDSMRE